jgi:hypothetical protein
MIPSAMLTPTFVNTVYVVAHLSRQRETDFTIIYNANI